MTQYLQAISQIALIIFVLTYFYKLFPQKKEPNKEDTFRSLIWKHQGTIWGLEIAQEVCNAEIKALNKKEKELAEKIASLKDLIKEQYQDEADIESLKIEVDALQIEQRILPEERQNKEKIKEIKEKIEKIGEMMKIKQPDLDFISFRKIIAELLTMEYDLSTYPNRYKGQEMTVKEQVDEISRNEATMNLIKEMLKKL